MLGTTGAARSPLLVLARTLIARQIARASAPLARPTMRPRRACSSGDGGSASTVREAVRMIAAVASSATPYKGADACPDRLTPTTPQAAANALMITDPMGLTPILCGRWP